MTREEKNQFIDMLAEKLTSSKHFYLTDVSGLTVSESNAFRRMCFNKGVTLNVVKNTLLKNAMEQAEGDYAESYEVLKGNTAVMFSEVGNIPAKLIKQFRKKHDKPVLKIAYVEEAFYLGDEQLSILSDIKSKNELIGDVIGLLQSPVKNVISALQSGGNQLSAILKTLSEKPAQSEPVVSEPVLPAGGAESNEEKEAQPTSNAEAQESPEAEAVPAADKETDTAPTEEEAESKTEETVAQSKPVVSEPSLPAGEAEPDEEMAEETEKVEAKEEEDENKDKSE